MVKKSLGVKSAKELNGATVCVQTGTTTELNLADYFKANNMTYKPVVFEKLDETVQAYLAGRCDVYTTDQSGLYSIRVQQPKPEDHVVLPEIISKEPLGPSVRQGDDAVADGRQVGALRPAQRRGGRHHPGQRRARWLNSTNPEIKRILGKDGELGKGLGLRQRLGRQRRQGGRQLRRAVRAQRRLGLAPQDRARPEQPLEQRRPAVRPAHPLDDNKERRPTPGRRSAFAPHSSAGSALHGCRHQRSNAPGATASRARLPLPARGAAGDLPDRAGRRARGPVLHPDHQHGRQPASSRTSPPASASSTAPPASTSRRR